MTVPTNIIRCCTSNKLRSDAVARDERVAILLLFPRSVSDAMTEQAVGLDQAVTAALNSHLSWQC